MTTKTRREARYSSMEWLALWLHVFASYGILVCSLYWIFVALMGREALSFYSIGSITPKSSLVIIVISIVFILIGDKINKNESRKNRYIKY